MQATLPSGRVIKLGGWFRFVRGSSICELEQHPDFAIRFRLRKGGISRSGNAQGVATPKVAEPNCYFEIPDSIRRLTNLFGLVSSCSLHDRDLVRDHGTERARRTADLYTVMALRHGSVELPSGAVVTAQCWLRLLRSLTQEVFFAEPFLVGHHTYAEPFLEVWRATGEARPQHGFSPLQTSFCFEDLAMFDRLKYVHAASAALDLIADGGSTASKKLCSAFLVSASTTALYLWQRENDLDK